MQRSCIPLSWHGLSVPQECISPACGHSPDIPVTSLHLFTAQREDFGIHTPPVKSQGARETHCYLSQPGINSSSQLFTRPSVTSLQLPCFHPEEDSPKNSSGAHSEQTSVQLKVYTSQSLQLRLWRLLRCRSNLLIHPLSCRHDGVELFHLFWGKWRAAVTALGW